mmetsp:Transcript_32778/g.79692  ORF Transcript_32778/g.79692 Transcript_32778/m.79692 type:complete len:103 (+) Transcript_32778:1879-2187(+)
MQIQRRKSSSRRVCVCSDGPSYERKSFRFVCIACCVSLGTIGSSVLVLNVRSFFTERLASYQVEEGRKEERKDDLVTVSIAFHFVWLLTHSGIVDVAPNFYL